MTMIDPATVDWSAEDDAAVYHAAKGGIPQAKRELARREAKGKMHPAQRAALVAKIKGTVH